MRKLDGSRDVYVLLVEDDRDDFYLTQDMLQRIERERYWVVWAGSYERAQLELRERQFDVALVDYRIGERTGLDFISEVGSRYPRTPMILLTGLADPDIDFAAERAGAADYLVKDSLTEGLLDRSIRYARQSAHRRALLDSVLHHAATGMIGLDPAGLPMIWNRKALEALELDQVPGSQLGAPMVASALGRMLDGRPGPAEISRADGRTFELSLSRMSDGGGVAVLHDITMRVEAERHLRQAVLEAERANKAKSSFLATMSHELRTPLNGILGMTRVLESTALTEVQRDGIDVIKGSGTTLLNIINDILDLSKIEAGRMELEEIEFSVSEIVDEVLRLLCPTALEKGVELAGFVDPLVASHMVGDPLRVRQVLTNLVGNAIKFTAAGSVTVIVDETTSGDGAGRPMLRFSVVDTGIGIPAVKLANLFVKFSQVDSSTTREYGGTGLGLALCKELVGLMQGEIECQSLPGHGSTFSFKLPIPDEHSAIALARQSAVQLSDARLLLATPSSGIAGVFSSYANALTATLTKVNTVEAARSAVETGTYTGVVVDGLLGTSGVRDLLATLKSTGPGSLYLLEGAPGQGRELGVEEDETLARPFGRQTFDKLTKLLRRAPKATASAPVASPAQAKGRPLRILMAEDNPANQRVASALLKTAGFNLEIVGNGRAAVDKAQSTEFDIILMDVQMPVMDGLEATRVLRASDRMKAVPIVGLTAGAMEDDKQKCLGAGMNDYLSKPVDWDKLLSLLTRIEKERYGAKAA
ncbi:MAG: response regulator [Hyphomicrobiaceae bacterium]|nr:response regulator [Hyphomicrobiaceae bacterium]